MSKENNPFKKINWSLFVGGLLILFITALAIWGPALAPRDPLEANPGPLLIGDHWDMPPYDPFTKGFPLGSDAKGRDVLSSLLWGVRPTLELVLIVAGARLLLGLTFGLAAGWTDRPIRKIVDIAISGAMAIPILLVALAMLAKFGQDLGSYITALVITGWAETAKMIQAETRRIKKQTYIEAAFALGAPVRRMLGKHVIRHLTPLLLILFSFEVSSTLLTVSTLGFLGFFIIDKRIIEFHREGYLPELGQMLAISINVPIQPWAMVAAGTVVFITILGFNLVGQGLRIRLNIQAARRRTWLDQWTERISLWIEQNIVFPIEQFLGERVGVAVRIILTLTLIMLIPGGELKQQFRSELDIDQRLDMNAILPKPLDTRVPTPAKETEPASNKPFIAWSFEVPDGSPAAPVIGVDGITYIVSHNNVLYALGTDGRLIWEKQLVPEPYHYLQHNGARTIIPPQATNLNNIIVIGEQNVYAIDKAGNKMWDVSLDSPPGAKFCCSWDQDKEIMYLLDESAALYAILPDSGLTWKYLPRAKNVVPRSKPVISRDGTIYYTFSVSSSRSTGFGDAFLQAVTPEGRQLWISTIPNSTEQGGQQQTDYDRIFVGPEEELIFVSGLIFDANNGNLAPHQFSDFVIDPKTAQELGIYDLLIGAGDKYEGKLTAYSVLLFVGYNGENYLITGSIIFRWKYTENGLKILNAVNANLGSGLGFPLPDEIGVTQYDLIWLRYAPSSDEARRFIEPQILWIDMERDNTFKVIDKQGNYQVAFDPENGSFYFCSAKRDPDILQCQDFSPWSDEPDWQITVDGVNSIKYGHLDLTTGRLYIFAKNNIFYVIDN